jgi:CBS domain-containing protein
MKVADVMTTEVQRCLASDRLDCVARMMWEHDCGALPVVDGRGRTISMITDRDVCMAAYTTGRPLHAIPVTAAASHGIHSVSPDDSIADAECVMKMHRVRRLPVIDVGGNLVGMISLADVLRHAGASAEGGEGGLDPDHLAATVCAVFRSHDLPGHH